MRVEPPSPPAPDAPSIAGWARLYPLSPDPLASNPYGREYPLSSKIARTLGALVVAGSPFIMSSLAPASAAGGCSVNNAATTTSVQVHVEAPPPVVTVGSPSLSCSYITEGGAVNFSCTLVGGRCEIYVNDAYQRSCIAYGNVTCNGQLDAVAGDVIRLEVRGGQGSISDAA